MKGKVKVKSLSHVRLCATPWTAAHQAPPSMGFPGESTGVGCHCLLQHLLHSDLISADLIGMEYYLRAASICISWLLTGSCIFSKTYWTFGLLLFSRYVVSNSLRPHGLYSPSSSSVHGISQARILEWVAISFSRGSSWPRDRTCIFCTGRTFFTTEPHVPSLLNIPPTPNPIPHLPCHPVFFLFWGISKPFSKGPNNKYFMLCRTKAKLRIVDKYFSTKRENKFLQILNN